MPDRSANVAMSVMHRSETELPTSVSPELLVARHVEDARRQLTLAREQLKGARRRVVQLEDAVTSWERLAHEVRSKASAST